VKRAIVVVTLAVMCVAPVRGQIKGCTSDVRTGVCNKVCSTKHVAGCTFDQLDPLLKIQSSQCLMAAANKNFDRIDKGLPTDKSETNKCNATLDREIEEWKKAHPKKN